MSQDSGDAKIQQGNFFAVDRRCVEEATCCGNDGMNTALAYLTLARHTARNHRTTTAATTAICNKIGLTRGRADLALKTLERAGLVSAPARGTFRTLTPWALLGATRGRLTDRQTQVLRRVLGRGNPITSGMDPDYQVAYGLKQKGILELTDGKPGKTRFRAAEPELVWLPNTMVDGFSEGDGPLARVRQIQDPKALLLLMDCYHYANLAEDGGLPWQSVRRTFKRLKIWEQGHFTVWGFVRGSAAGAWDPLFTRFRGKDNDEASAALWRTYDALKSAGLIEEVGYVVEGLTPGAQAIHPYALPGSGEPEEQAVRTAAHEAGKRMLAPGKYEWAADQLGPSLWLCPIRSHVTGAELIGIVRPVHRPHTKRTAAWAANFLADCASHAALFENLGKSAAAPDSSVAA